MRILYIDTGAFIALIRRRDRAHGQVRDHYHRLKERKDGFLTSNLALAETATRLRYDAGIREALAFRAFLEDVVASGRLVVRYADEALDRKAWDLMERYSDRALSFADCVGAVTAREASVAAVFGLDSDFLALGFALEP